MRAVLLLVAMTAAFSAASVSAFQFDEFEDLPQEKSQRTKTPSNETPSDETSSDESPFNESPFGKSPFDAKPKSDEADEDEEDEDEVDDESKEQPVPEPADGPVGDYGDLRRLEFSGNETFPADELRDSLTWDINCIKAVRPSSSLRQLKEVVRARLIAGYKTAGFPFATIGVHEFHEPPRLRAYIAEGPRYLCGDVIVREPDDRYRLDRTDVDRAKVSAARLQEWLATPPAKRLDAAWAKRNGEDPSRKAPWADDQPAPFFNLALTRIVPHVVSGLREQGWVRVKDADISIERRPGGGFADLIVEINDFGPPGKLTEVRVSGLTRNTSADLAKFLGLRVGQNVNGDELRRIENQLSETGRFHEIRAAVEAADDESGVALVLTGVEIQHLPPVTEPLNHAQQALLRHCQWLNALSDHGEDLVFTFRTERADIGKLEGKCIFSPGRGCLGVVRGTLKGHELNHGIYVTEGKAVLFAANSQRMYELSDVANMPKFELRFHPTFDKESDSWQTSVWLGFQRADEKSLRAAPLLSIRFEPAALLGTGEEARIENGKLIVVSESGAYTEADATTGRLSMMRAAGEPAHGFYNSIHVERGAFDKKLAQITKETARFTNVADEKRYLATISAFVLDEAYQIYAAATGQSLEPASADARFKMFVKLLAPLEELLKQQSEEGKDALANFHIPSEHGVDLSLTDVASWLFFTSRFLTSEYEHGTWPWAIAHEASLIAAGEGGLQSLSELHRVMRDESTGPLAMLLFAEAAGFVDQGIGTTIARLGLDRIDDPKKFRADIEALVPAEGKIARVATRLAEALRGLTDEEFDALQRSLPSDWRPVLVLIDEHVRRNREPAPREALLSLLEACWAQWGRVAAKREMQRIAAGAAKTIR